MRLNPVQHRLIQELLDYAHQKYPEVSLREITESPGGSAEHVLVVVNGIDWDDDDEVMDFTRYMSLKQDDILVEYGYPFSVMPLPENGGNGKNRTFWQE